MAHTITIRSNNAETRHSIPLIDDACQTCYQVGLVAHLDVEDWRICCQCLNTIGWTITSFPIPLEAHTLSDPATLTLTSSIETTMGLTPPERTIIRHAVTDHTPIYYNMPRSFGLQDAVRRTVDAHVMPSINGRRKDQGREKLTREEIIELVSDEAIRQLDTVTAFQAYKDGITQFEEHVARRQNLATQCVGNAHVAWKAGNTIRAIAMVNLAESTSPIIPAAAISITCKTYDQYRERLAQKRWTTS